MHEQSCQIDPDVILLVGTTGKTQVFKRPVSSSIKTSAHSANSMAQDLSIEVDPRAERELFGDQNLPIMSDEELDFVDDVSENMSLEDILALAQDEENRCGQLEEQRWKAQEG